MLRIIAFGTMAMLWCCTGFGPYMGLLVVGLLAAHCLSHIGDPPAPAGRDNKKS